MNLPLFFTTIKIYLTFCDTNNYKNGKYNSCAASIFSETHIFRKEYSFLIYTENRKEENTASLSIQKTERKKKFEFEQ